MPWPLEDQAKITERARSEINFIVAPENPQEKPSEYMP
jgi:hypothetical protein